MPRLVKGSVPFKLIKGTDPFKILFWITNDAGVRIWSWKSDAFGTTAPDEDVDGDLTNFKFNMRFPGQFFDVESGMHYNYFRDYEPGTGRYLQSDPIGLGGGVNTFGHVGGNPLGYSDVFGLQFNRNGERIEYYLPWPMCLVTDNGCNPDSPDPIETQIEIIKDCSICIITCPKDVLIGDFGEELIDDVVEQAIKRKVRSGGGIGSRIIKKILPGYSQYSTAKDILNIGSCSIDCINK